MLLSDADFILQLLTIIPLHLPLLSPFQIIQKDSALSGSIKLKYCTVTNLPNPVYTSDSTSRQYSFYITEYKKGAFTNLEKNQLVPSDSKINCRYVLYCEDEAERDMWIKSIRVTLESIRGNDGVANADRINEIMEEQNRILKSQEYILQQLQQSSNNTNRETLALDKVDEERSEKSSKSSKSNIEAASGDNLSSMSKIPAKTNFDIRPTKERVRGTLKGRSTNSATEIRPFTAPAGTNSMKNVSRSPTINYENPSQFNTPPISPTPPITSATSGFPLKKSISSKKVPPIAPSGFEDVNGSINLNSPALGPITQKPKRPSMQLEANPLQQVMKKTNSIVQEPIAPIPRSNVNSNGSEFESGIEVGRGVGGGVELQAAVTLPLPPRPPTSETNNNNSLAADMVYPRNRRPSVTAANNNNTATTPLPQPSTTIKPTPPTHSKPTTSIVSQSSLTSEKDAATSSPLVVRRPRSASVPLVPSADKSAVDSTQQPPSLTPLAEQDSTSMQRSQLLYEESKKNELIASNTVVYGTAFPIAVTTQTVVSDNQSVTEMTSQTTTNNLISSDNLQIGNGGGINNIDNINTNNRSLSTSFNALPPSVSSSSVSSSTAAQNLRVDEVERIMTQSVKGIAIDNALLVASLAGKENIVSPDSTLRKKDDKSKKKDKDEKKDTLRRLTNFSWGKSKKGKEESGHYPSFY